MEIIAKNTYLLSSRAHNNVLINVAPTMMSPPIVGVRPFCWCASGVPSLIT